MPLTEFQIKHLRPKEKRYLVNDGQGLYIAVMPSGEKYWYYRTVENGKERKRSLGRYPDIGLKEARELRYTAKTGSTRGAASFASVLEKWFVSRLAQGCKPSTLRRHRLWANRYILPNIGHRNIKTITPKEVAELVQPISARSPSMGKNVLSDIIRIFKYAVASGLCEWNPGLQVSGVLRPYRVGCHHSTITTEEQAQDVIRGISAYQGNVVMRYALLILAYTFVRKNELRLAEWQELDLDGGKWLIPAERTKMGREHIVPLATQVVQMFRELQAINGGSRYIFSIPPSKKALGISTLPRLMRVLGYGRGKATPHSFRGMASTLLNEHGWNRDVIERQLAHMERNSVRDAYNHAEYMEERRRMMQWWADYLDGLCIS